MLCEDASKALAQLGYFHKNKGRIFFAVFKLEVTSGASWFEKATLRLNGSKGQMADMSFVLFCLADFHYFISFSFIYPVGLKGLLSLSLFHPLRCSVVTTVHIMETFNCFFVQ